MSTDWCNNTPISPVDFSSRTREFRNQSVVISLVGQATSWVSGWSVLVDAAVILFNTLTSFNHISGCARLALACKIFAIIAVSSALSARISRGDIFASTAFNWSEALATIIGVIAFAFLAVDFVGAVFAAKAFTGVIRAKRAALVTVVAPSITLVEGTFWASNTFVGGAAITIIILFLGGIARAKTATQFESRIAFGALKFTSAFSAVPLAGSAS